MGSLNEMITIVSLCSSVSSLLSDLFDGVKSLISCCVSGFLNGIFLGIGLAVDGLSGVFKAPTEI
jgi:phage-related protein